MEKSETTDPKAEADRKKFENITKVEVQPLTIKSGAKGQNNVVFPELKSPDESNPKWIADPEEAIKARRAKARAEKRAKKEE